MITVEEAFEIIDKYALPLAPIAIPFNQCLGRILAEDILADRDFPPYHRAAMDGIAVLQDDWQKGYRKFRIVGQQVAGIAQQSLAGEGTCMEVMTGAILPAGADTIIRYEDLQIVNAEAQVKLEEVKAGANIHRQGTDCEQGSLIIPNGKMLNVGDIGIIASVGKSDVMVRSLPKVAVISTGDELVEIEQKPQPFQIRKSNVHTLSILLQQRGIAHELYHFDDELESIKRGLENIIKDHQVIMMSGGVSMGKKDFIPAALKAIGVKEYFHRVRQRPGKPMWFGGNDKVTVFGFPGNPVSTLACFTVYFNRWLNQSLTGTSKKVWAELSEDVFFQPDLFYFLPVSLHQNQATLLAKPHKGHGSGDLVSLSKMDGFLCLPPGKEVYQSGEVYEVIYPV